MFAFCKQQKIGEKMTNRTIAFRINDETYLRLNAIAAEKGLSIGSYLKKKLEDEDENLLNDIRLMQIDLKDIINILGNIGNQKSSVPSSTPQQNFSVNENILLEILMILRELAQPSKLANAQAKVESTGNKIYKLSENQV